MIDDDDEPIMVELFGGPAHGARMTVKQSVALRFGLMIDEPDRRPLCQDRGLDTIMTTAHVYTPRYYGDGRLVRGGDGTLALFAPGFPPPILWATDRPPVVGATLRIGRRSDRSLPDIAASQDCAQRVTGSSYAEALESIDAALLSWLGPPKEDDHGN